MTGRDDAGPQERISAPEAYALAGVWFRMTQRLGLDLITEFNAAAAATDRAEADLGPDVGLQRFAAAATGIFERAEQVLRAEAPANWGRLSMPPGSTAGVILAGIPLAWVPDLATVDQLLAGKDRPAWYATLRSREKAVLDACAEQLTAARAAPAFDADAMEHLLVAGHGCVAAARIGLCGPAQSHAFNLVDVVLRRGFPPTPGTQYKYKKVTEDIQAARASQDQYRLILTYLPALTALTPFFEHHAGSIPDLPSRHATAHTLDPIQMTDVNALCAVMLAVSLLREGAETGWPVPATCAPAPDPG